MRKTLLTAITTLLLQSQSRNICWPLIAIVVGFFQIKTTKRRYGTAIIIGAVSDILTGRLIGQTALFFVIFVGVLDLLSLRFKLSLKLALGLAIVFQIVYLFMVNFFNF